MPEPTTLWPILLAFLGAVGGGLGAPIPEEAVVIGAGIWVANIPEIGWIRWSILPVCIIGILIADLILYSIGRIWGPRLLEKKWVARFLPPDKMQQIEDNFHRYGVKILLFVRWLPGIRSPMFITAGVMRLPLTRFVVADSIAAAIGHTALFFLAWWFGDQFKELVERAEARLGPILAITAFVLVVAYFAFKVYRRPVATGDPEELPLVGHQVATRIEHQASADGPKTNGEVAEPKSHPDREMSTDQP